MSFRYCIYCFFILAFHFVGYTQELPPIDIFTSDMYGAEHQNWSIAQSKEKHIYVANNKGLLEYNGSKWQLYNSPNETILRSVAVIDDKVYTGAYMDFGYWTRNDHGLLEYNSLVPSLKEPMLEDEQIWKIIELDDFILFQSFNRIYLYNSMSSEFKFISSDKTITKMFLVDDVIMFHGLNDGIYKIENGEAKLVSSHPLIQEETIINIFGHDGHFLIQTEDKGFYELENGDPTKWDIEANDLLNTVNIYNSIRLKDESFVIGTISNGIIHLTADGKVNYEIDQEKGLSNNTVLSLFEDMDQNIWLGLDNGINCINMKSRFRVYKDQKGKLGTIYASILFEDKLYVGTNQGLFMKGLDEEEFEFIAGTEGQVWNLKSFDNTLFCCHNNGTYVISDKKANLVSRFPGTWDIKEIEGRPDILMQGKYEGLNLLEKVGGNWQFKHGIDGFVNSSRFFELTPDNEVFVSHEYRGVFKVQLNKDLTKAIEVIKALELPKSLHASLVEYNDEYLYSYKDGIYKYDGGLKEFKKDTLLSSVYDMGEFTTGKLVVDPVHERFWSFTDQYINYVGQGRLSKSPEINTIAFPGLLSSGITGFENISQIYDQTYLYGNSDGYVLIDLNIDDALEDYVIKINSIKKGKLGKVETYAHLDNDPVFENVENNLEISFSVPEFEKFSETRYRYQLIGMYDEWSDWSLSSTVPFKNLPHGDYTFNVAAKVGNKELEKFASYDFQVARPWYLSNLMIFIYVLGTVLLVSIIHTMYRRYYKKQRERLLIKTQRELEIKQMENEQQRMQFKNESLKQDIESKNRELAISTMSLIKKNEFLGNLKDELKSKGQGQDLNSIVKIIDQNLNNTDDWKFFQEAFNNADKDFLKKVKTIHPSLTPNDLKLCAYLRLNLSSKEIAPLLNISPRSVEVKRYRLRKKMELEHEVSLTNYILEL